MISSNRSGLFRKFICSECHKPFKTRVDLIWHAEDCATEAFEAEAMTVLMDISSVRRKFCPPVSRIPAGITVKNLDLNPRQEMVRLKVGSHMSNQESRKTMVKMCRTVDVVQPTEIRGPRGLTLMVSVEKEQIEDVEVEEPPLLYPETGDMEELHMVDDDVMDDVHDDMNTVGTSYEHHQPVFAQQHPQVIGALANANDDTFKPKMECPTCGLILFRHNFATHYRIHTGELPFACSYCPKRFRTTSSLKVHIRSHTGEKPYNCPQCSYATITKRNLDRHILIHHVRQPVNRGPVMRKSRYRDNPEVEWMNIHHDDDDVYGTLDNSEDVNDYQDEPQSEIVDVQHIQDSKDLIVDIGAHEILSNM